jgi:hypothetical protein
LKGWLVSLGDKATTLKNMGDILIILAILAAILYGLLKLYDWFGALLDWLNKREQRRRSKKK